MPNTGGLATTPVPLRPHPALYILPVLFGVLGGVVAWLLLRGSGSMMGRNCLLVGAISSLVSLVAYMALGVGVVEEPDRVPWNA